MAVAEPCCKKEWEEWKREMEEKRRRRWTEKVSYWANLEVSDDEEGEEEEEEASECEEDEGNEGAAAGGQNEMSVKVRWSEKEGEMVDWEEGEDVSEPQVMEEAGGKEVEIEENERAMDGRVEEGLLGADDDEEEQQLGQTGECGRMELEQERPEDQMEEEDRGAEPRVMEEDEEAEVEDEVPERVGTAVGMMMDVKVHADEEQGEVEQTGEKRGNDEEEEDWYKAGMDDEERAEVPNERNKENSLLEGHHKFTEEPGMAERPPTDDLEDPEEEEESDEKEEEEIADEDEVKTYGVDGYPSEIFSVLKVFRDERLLTDLTLSTADGSRLHVHAAVLAAVSSVICQRLRGRTVENSRLHVRLGPEVDALGLAAVVEFAYAGSVSALDADMVHAAATLGASRVVELCRQAVQREEAPGDQQKEEGALEEQRVTLRTITKMWTDNVGCDVILEAIGGSLPAHRVILAAGSDYFRCMFTSGMKECRQAAVRLPTLSASELEALIKCSYSGELPLRWSCVFETTSTALQLQHLPALRLCLDFMRREMNPLSCLDVASFAEAYALAELLDVSHDYVLRQFQKVASTSKFKDLPAEQLLRYLNSPSLCVPSELAVFRAVVAWIQWKPRTRRGLAEELMRTVHFSLMTYKEFKEVQFLEMWSDPGLEGLYTTIFEDFCGSDTAPQIQYRTYLPKESLVVIGGEQTFEDLGSRRICRELWFANSIRHHTGIKKATEWRKLTEMPDQGRFCHQVAVLRGQLYVFGGKKYYGTNDTLNSVYRYDPLQDSWENLAGMQEKRCSFSAVVLDGRIYAIGGHCGPVNVESVERYCPLANAWSYTSPLDLPLSAHAANVLHGQVFVSGGLTDDFCCLASTFVYQPQTGSTNLANMVQPRAQHCMEVLGEHLYVAGGITTDEGAAPVDLLACEMYHPAADCWTAIASLPVPHVGAGSAVSEGKFYVLGGYSQEDYSDTLMIHRYDPAAQSWENTGNTPGPNNDIRASVLRLPPHLRV